MKSLLAGLKKLPALFKKHWWKIAIVLALLKIAPIIIWWHHIEQRFVSAWSWWNSINIWLRVLIGFVLCFVLFLGLLRVEISMEKEEDNKQGDPHE